MKHVISAILFVTGLGIAPAAAQTDPCLNTQNGLTVNTCGVVPPVTGPDFIVNGSFETGDASGWTVAPLDRTRLLACGFALQPTPLVTGQQFSINQTNNGNVVGTMVVNGREGANVLLFAAGTYGTTQSISTTLNGLTVGATYRISYKARSLEDVAMFTRITKFSVILNGVGRWGAAPADKSVLSASDDGTMRSAYYTFVASAASQTLTITAWSDHPYACSSAFAIMDAISVRAVGTDPVTPPTTVILDPPTSTTPVTVQDPVAPNTTLNLNQGTGGPGSSGRFSNSATSARSLRYTTPSITGSSGPTADSSMFQP